MVFLAAGFPPVFPKKRLEPKSFKGQTNAEEEGTPGPFAFPLSLRLPLKAFSFEPFLREKMVENGGTEDAPRGDGPSLK